MKISIFGLALTFSAAVGALSVSGQDIRKIEELPVPCAIAEKQEIRRSPKAEVVLDERGDSVYKINANETWRRTDVEVKRGQKVEITATGIIRWAQDGSDWTIVTPNGTRAPCLNYFPHPDAGIGSLVIRIGKAVYPAGSNVTIESEDEGYIELQINDDILTDNSGHFLVN